MKFYLYLNLFISSTYAAVNDSKCVTNSVVTSGNVNCLGKFN